MGNNKKSPSAFHKTVGFRTVTENNPVFDTTMLNQSFANNMSNFNSFDMKKLGGNGLNNIGIINNSDNSFQENKDYLPENSIFKNNYNNNLNANLMIKQNPNIGQGVNSNQPHIINQNYMTH